MFSLTSGSLLANFCLSSSIRFNISSENCPLCPKLSLSLDRYSVKAASLLSINNKQDMAIMAADSSVPETIEKEETSLVLYAPKPKAFNNSF